MKNLLLILICAFALFSCSQENAPTPSMMSTMTDPMKSSNPPENAVAVRMGDFLSYAHGLSGSSTLYLDSIDHRTLRFESFTMSQGPDVYVFLSKSNNYSNANVIKIARLAEGYNNDSISFVIDSSVDLDTYKFVLVYCLQYNSLFGYVELKKL